MKESFNHFRNDEDRRNYNKVLEGLRRMEPSISVSGGTDREKLMHQVMGNNPDLFYVKPIFALSAGFGGGRIIPQYMYSRAEAKSLSDKVNEIADTVIRERIRENHTEFEKVRIFHDYLASEVKYDSTAKFEEGNTAREFASFSVVGAFIYKNCVCEGFAEAMKFFCDKVGIECMIVSGIGTSPVSTGPHAWNIVKINGYYHHVDVTWDCVAGSSIGLPNYNYLNLSDDEISKDHTWDREDYPACPTSPYNYFDVNGALIDSEAHLESFLCDSFYAEEKTIMFRIVKGSSVERRISDNFEEIIMRAVKRCGVLINGYRVLSVREQLIFYILIDEYNY